MSTVGKVESRLVVASDWKKRRVDSATNECRLSFQGDEDILEFDSRND